MTRVGSFGLVFPPAVAVALWTPASLGSGLVEWWDPSFGVTASGGAVSAWQGRFANTVASQSTAANQPTTTTLNGKPGIAFNGSQSLAFNGSTFPQGNSATTVAISAFCTASSSGFFGAVGWGLTSNSSRLFASNNGKVDAALAASDIIISNTWTSANLFICWCLTSAGASNIWVDGATPSTGSNSLGTHTGDTGAGIGVWPSYGNQWVGTIQNIVALNRVLTTSERQKLEGWESWVDGKAGSNLPSGHPYKSRAPNVNDP